MSTKLLTINGDIGNPLVHTSCPAMILWFLTSNLEYNNVTSKQVTVNRPAAPG